MNRRRFAPLVGALILLIPICGLSADAAGVKPVSPPHGVPDAGTGVATWARGHAAAIRQMTARSPRQPVSQAESPAGRRMPAIRQVPPHRRSRGPRQQGFLSAYGSQRASIL
jgi:hypothetical protein